MRRSFYPYNTYLRVLNSVHLSTLFNTKCEEKLSGNWWFSSYLVL